MAIRKFRLEGHTLDKIITTNRRLAIIKSAILCISVVLFQTGCTHVASLRVYPDDVPAGSLRLVQAIIVGSRTDIVDNSNEWYQALLASGITDDAIIDGSVAVGRIFCCGGPNEIASRQAFYIPLGIQVKPLDIVEIIAGSDPKDHSVTRVNTAIRVVQRAEPTVTGCDWIPLNPRLWRRILFCDWMKKDGWIELEDGLYHTWYKPPPSQ